MNSFFMYIILFIYLFLTVLDLCCCMGFSLVVASKGCPPAVVLALLTAVASLVAEHGLQGTGASGVRALVGVHRLSCSKACGILPVKGSNPCLLHWQVDSLPLSYQGSPRINEFLQSIGYMDCMCTIFLALHFFCMLHCCKHFMISPKLINKNISLVRF